MRPGDGRTCQHCRTVNDLGAARCAECSRYLGAGKRAQPTDDESACDGQCSWESVGLRCRYPATWSNATNGAGPWYCSMHAVTTSAAAGGDIVQASMDYQPETAEHRHASMQAIVSQSLRDAGRAGTRADALALVRSARVGSRGADWARRIIARAQSGEAVGQYALDRARVAVGVNSQKEDETHA